jgi:hypothetical protein
MGGALGAILARTSVPMKEWGSNPDDKPDQSLRTEGMAIGVMLLAVYLLVGIDGFTSACRWLGSLFGGAG